MWSSWFVVKDPFLDPRFGVSPSPRDLSSLVLYTERFLHNDHISLAYIPRLLYN